jgi:hypothetical protein
MKHITRVFVKKNYEKEQIMFVSLIITAIYVHYSTIFMSVITEVDMKKK